jgi:hypothetical protein
MAKYYLIDGYFKDDKSEFNGFIVKDYDDATDGDDDVFYYGLSEENLKEAIIAGEDTSFDFVITNYVFYQEN